jgi:hypothetical protein
LSAAQRMCSQRFNLTHSVMTSSISFKVSGIS